MKKIITLKVAGKDVHLPRLIGSFLVFAAILMFFKAGAVMFESWENTKLVNSCLAAQPALDQPFEFCQNVAKDSLDVYVRNDQSSLNSKQFWSALLGPVSSLLFWAAAFIFGLILYRSGNLALPIEEDIREVSPWPTQHKRKRR